MFDTWATARIDTMLLDYYGPDLYRKMTSSYDPEGVAAAIQNINSIHSGMHRQHLNLPALFLVVNSFGIWSLVSDRIGQGFSCNRKFSLQIFIMRAMLTVGVDEISDRFGGHFDGWSDEDVIRAYLVHHLRKQDNESQMQQLEYLTPLRPMFTSSSQLEGYRSMSGSLLTVK